MRKPEDVAQEMKHFGDKAGVLAPWSERIPAAIEKAEENAAEYIASHPNYEAGDPIITTKALFTAGELALAEALWEKCDSDNYNDPQAHDWTPPSALIAFCEKVEKLT